MVDGQRGSYPEDGILVKGVDVQRVIQQVVYEMRIQEPGGPMTTEEGLPEYIARCVLVVLEEMATQAAERGGSAIVIPVTVKPERFEGPPFDPNDPPF